MKKIIYSVLMAGVLVAMPACSSHDYDEVSTPHVYSETENPPIKGSDANMAVTALNIPQGKTDEIRTIDLNEFDDQIKEQLGMSLDEAISGLSSGSTRFLMANPVRRIWDKTPANGGENSWYISPSGIICDPEQAVAQVTFYPTAKNLEVKITEKATGAVVPIMFGFVKTDDSAYPVNFRAQAILTVTDASVVDVEVIVPQGDYNCGYVEFETLETNIAYALDGMTLAAFAEAMDISNGVFTAYLMSQTGQLYGGEGSYTANGYGYWMTEAAEICNWGAEGFAMYVEPDCWDWDTEQYYTNGGYLAVGRLNNDTPPSGATRKFNYVLQLNSNPEKTLTLMITAYFE